MRLTTRLLISAMTAATLLSGCTPKGASEASKAELVISESKALNDWFAARFDDQLARSPMMQTYLGQKDNQDRLDDSSQLADDEGAALTEQWLKDMRARFDIDRLDAQSKLSYRLYEFAAKDDLESHAYSDHDYVFQHMSGPHSDLPSFMINFHQISSELDAKAYIARLDGVRAYMGHYIEKAEAQAAKGVVLPKFVYGKITPAARNVITGAPFDDSGADSPLLSDFKDKIGKLTIAEAVRDDLVKEAEAALLRSVEPAYTDMIDMFARHAAIATDDDGAWKLPNGEAYYQARLKHYTTTELTADEIHNIGLSEVARIQDEMRQIMTQVGFEGDLKNFYTLLRTDPQFVYPETDAGAEAYITDATAIIDDMKGRMDSLFITQPKADMVVKRVEAFREDTAFGAFYDQPALDGSRPGTYYINMKVVADQPKYLMQALAYHEGIPGHHMQIAIGMELDGLPKFRTLGGHTAYIEGWALYAEAVPKELGLYTDPYSDFGRLSMEIFRAARLVVDTGIHSKKWTREEAVQYYLDNIPNPEGDVRAEIDRYIVWPGQATAYKIGMLKIEELRAGAEAALGDRFDVREFHDVVLANGSVPLSVLEELVQEWTQDTLSK
ncbi:DUF885 family protein [Fretibacter rubidus]|uniref:DUF885 domain-containing protein n=1 Tax=Fretibacter rubidus TaxID=570162 RepID=UPI003529DDCC